jgi:hypothetical protein
VNAARLTSGSGSSSWRTPNSQLIEAKPYGTKLFGRTPADPQVGLADQVANWPTVCASEVRQGFQDRSRGMKGSQESLTTAVILHGQAAPASSSTSGSLQGLWQATKHKRGDLWSTPRTGATESSRPNNKGGIPLADQAKREQWATPQAKDHKSGHRHPTIVQYKQLNVEVEARATGKLNPRWVETLMGLPIGWTMPSCTSPQTIAPMSCDSSATELSRPPQSEPSEFFLAS